MMPPLILRRRAVQLFRISGFGEVFGWPVISQRFQSGLAIDDRFSARVSCGETAWPNEQFRASTSLWK